MAYLPRQYRNPNLPTLDELAEGFQATGPLSESSTPTRGSAPLCVVKNGYLQNVMEARPWDFYPWVEGNGISVGGFAINLSHQNAATMLHRLGPIKHRRFISQKYERPLYFRDSSEASDFIYHCFTMAKGQPPITTPLPLINSKYHRPMIKEGKDHPSYYRPMIKEGDDLPSWYSDVWEGL